MLADLLRAYALAQEFGWTLPQIRAMEGRPSPGFVSAEEWELWNLILQKIAAHRYRPR